MIEFAFEITGKRKNRVFSTGFKYGFLPHHWHAGNAYTTLEGWYLTLSLIVLFLLHGVFRYCLWWDFQMNLFLGSLVLHYCFTKVLTHVWGMLYVPIVNL
jgi:hypothetical protein